MGRPASGNALGFFTRMSATNAVLILLQIVVVLLAIELLSRPGTAWKATGFGAVAVFGVLNLLVVRSSQRDAQN